MTVPFDNSYAVGALRELQYRGVQVDPGLTDSELGAVERAVGAPLPPDLALLLQTGVPSGEHFPNWRSDPEGEMQQARARTEQAFRFDIEAEEWWFDGWRHRPRDAETAWQIALRHLSSAPPLVPIYAHRFMPTEPVAFGNPVLSVWQATDAIYYGYDLAHYLHHEFGVPRPSWSARIPPHVPVWGDLFDLPAGAQNAVTAIQSDRHTDDEPQWYAALLITGSKPPEMISAALGMQPSRVEIDEEGSWELGDDGKEETSALYTWMLDSRLPSAGGVALSLDDHIEDVLDQRTRQRSRPPRSES